MLTGRWQWIAYFLAPVALLLGVAFQRYSVEVYDQSAWSGGGFGMFSTVDISDGRARRAYLLTDQGPALVTDATFLPRWLYTKPRPERMDVAAEALLKRSWAIYGPESYRALWPAFPDLLKAYFRSSPEWMAFLSDSTADVAGVRGLYPELLAFEGRQAPLQGIRRSVRVQGARTEVWKPVFYREENYVRWEPLAEGNALAPAQPESQTPSRP